MKDPARRAAVRTARALPMSQPRPTTVWPAILGCLLAISSVGCQTYPANYSYPVYQPGSVVPYNGAPVGVPGGYQGGGIVPPGQSFPQSGMYPQQGGPGGYPPGGAPPFTPGYNPNYALPPVNSNPNPGAGSLPPGTGFRSTEIEGDNLGPAAPFPNGTTTPTTSRPKMPADDRFPSVPVYSDPNDQPTSGPPVNNTNTRAPNKGSFGSESFQEEINAGQQKANKLKALETEEPTVPAAAVPKKAGMTMNDVDGSTQDFIAPVDTRMVQQNIIQTAQHLERAPIHRPYGRAANGQAWFRGVVDFDEQERTWYLIYNPQPDESDERGGIVTLLEHPHLQYLRSDDTVLIEGVFEPQATDRYGHPKYRISNVKRLVPPQ